MDWATLFGLFYNVGIGWVGNAAIAGAIWAVIGVYAAAKMGLNMEGAIVAGGAIFLIFAATMIEGGIGLVVVFGLVMMALFILGILRVMRK